MDIEDLRLALIELIPDLSEEEILTLADITGILYKNESKS